MKRVYVRIIKEYKINLLASLPLIETIYKMFSHGKMYLLIRLILDLGSLRSMIKKFNDRND